MLCLLRASQPGTQGFFELPVYPLHHPVGLWMVGGGELALYTELLAETAPQGRDELAAQVRSEEGRHFKACYPGGGEGVRARCSFDVPEQNSLQPAGSAVDHCEKVSVPLRRGGEGSNLVDVHVGETMAWHGDGLHSGGGLLCDWRVHSVGSRDTRG